jgi:hypothetical protein
MVDAAKPKPIETAPRDKKILGFENGWFPMCWDNRGWELSGCVWADESYDCKPTHWLPMPEVPK